MGVLAQGRAQVSMNITDYRATPIRDVFARVKQLAADEGAAIANCELIGLIPADAYEPDSEWARLTTESLTAATSFDPERKVLERMLDHPLPWPE